MTVELEMSPEIEARLSKAAAVRGLDVSTYASRVLTDVVGLEPVERPVRTPEEISASFDRLGKMFPGGVRDDLTYDREMIYSDYDDV